MPNLALRDGQGFRIRPLSSEEEQKAAAKDARFGVHFTQIMSFPEADSFR
jgi:hypothetical protein